MSFKLGEPVPDLAGVDRDGARVQLADHHPDRRRVIYLMRAFT